MIEVFALGVLTSDDLIHLRKRQRRASSVPANVRFWHQTDLLRCSIDVCLRRKSGHSGCLLDGASVSNRLSCEVLLPASMLGVTLHRLTHIHAAFAPIYSMFGFDGC